MRHKNRKGRLHRNISHRKALMKNMAIGLIKYQRIETTMAKAKALRMFVEPLVTLAKDGSKSLHARRLAFQRLCSKETVEILFNDLAPLFKGIPGGYTRIIPGGFRVGDGASMVVMEFTKKSVKEKEAPKEGELEDKKKSKKKAVAEKKGKKEDVSKKDKTEDAEPEVHHAAPESDIREEDEKMVEDVRKEKAKHEQEKVKKGGFFRQFRRKSI